MRLALRQPAAALRCRVCTSEMPRDRAGNRRMARVNLTPKSHLRTALRRLALTLSNAQAEV